MEKVLENKALTKIAEKSGDESRLDNPGSQVAPAQKTFGEKLFDRSLYIGIGYIVNLFLGVAVADYFCNGKGKSKLEAFTRWTAGNDPVRAKKMEGMWKTALLTMGGTIMMIPVKIMEDNKRRIVHWINRKSGCADAITKDGKEAPISQLSEDELPAVVNELPKQSWGRVIARRALGVGINMGIGYVLGKDNLSKIEDAVTDRVISGMKKSESVPLNKLANNTMFKNWTRLTSLDWFYTVVTAATTYLTNGGKKNKSTQGGPVDAPEMIADAIDTQLEKPTTKPNFTARVEHKEITPVKAKVNESFESMVTQQKQQAETLHSVSA